MGGRGRLKKEWQYDMRRAVEKKVKEMGGDSATYTRRVGDKIRKGQPEISQFVHYCESERWHKNYVTLRLHLKPGASTSKL